MKKFFTLIAVAVLAFAAQANELTVCQGSYYSSVSPLCGLYADTEGTMTQSIYPADMLAEMEGYQITAIKFYTLAYYYEMNGMVDDDETDYINFDGAKFQLSLKEVDELGFEEAVAVIGATAVATSVPEYGDMEVEFILDEPFEYNGKNLLVEVECIETEGDWGMTYFYGDGVEGYNCAYSFVDNEANISSYLPMATFTYEESTVVPSDEHAEGVWLVTYDMNGEEIWTEMNESNGDYNVILRCSYGIYGTFDYYGGETRPDIEYYIVVDGVRYGAAADGTLTILGEAMKNPLTEGVNNYVLGEGLGKVYNMGVAIDEMTGDMYVYAAVAGYTDVNEMNADKAVAGVRYFNMAGQEMKEANGMTIVVTTYTDGTTSAAKVMK